MAGKKKATDDLISRMNVGGRRVLVRASEFTSSLVLRLPTGITTLDFALAGGFPSGVINGISGPESSGKDMLAFYMVAQQQKLHGREASIVWIPTEATGFDKMRARELGVNVALTSAEIDVQERFYGQKFDREARARLGRQLGEFSILPGKSAEQMFEELLRIVKDNSCQLVVLNSVDSLIPSLGLAWAENEDELLERMGIVRKVAMEQARLVTDFLKRYTSVLNQMHNRGHVMRTTILAVRQVRADVNFRGNPAYQREYTSKVGARSLLHALLDVVDLRSGKLMKGGKDEVLGKEIRWEITKGKGGSHEGMRGLFSFYFDAGVDLADNLLQAAIDQRLAADSGGGNWTVHTTHGEILAEARGRAQMANSLRLDGELYARVRSLVLGRISRPWTHNWKGEED